MAIGPNRSVYRNRRVLPRGNICAICPFVKAAVQKPEPIASGSACGDRHDVAGSTFTPGPIVEEIATRWM